MDKERIRKSPQTKDMKATIEQIEFLLGVMKSTQVEHPKAKVYYDWEDAEVRITYPLPADLRYFKGRPTKR